MLAREGEQRERERERERDAKTDIDIISPLAPGHYINNMFRFKITPPLVFIQLSARQCLSLFTTYRERERLTHTFIVNILMAMQWTHITWHH